MLMDDHLARMAEEFGDRTAFAVVDVGSLTFAEWDGAAGSTADYLSAGPVTATPTKPGRPGTGLDYVSYAARSAEGRPWFVTGGVTPETVPTMAAAGARRFVVVRYLTESVDPEGAARTLRGAVDAAVNAAGDPASR